MFVHPDTDCLPGEINRVRQTTFRFAARLLGKGLLVALIGILTAGLWPLFLVGLAIWGWPPHQPRPSEVVRFLSHAMTERPPLPGIAPLSRVWLVLSIVQKFLLVPVHGLAWYVDEALYGRRLRDTPVVAPLIVLTAARSGSTQTARYLEQDPRLTAPSMLQIYFPYLWLWRLAGPTLGRIVSPDRVRALFRAMATEEFHQRHEGDPFLTDTLEILFFARHLYLLAPLLGPRIMAEEFAFAPVGDAPHSRRLWEEDFVEFLDRLGRKTLLAGGPGRLLVKGHFLAAADAVAGRFPDAHFLTVIRDPLPRLQSMVNHLHGNPFDEALGAAPWAWIAAAIEASEVAYCEAEKEWFTRPDGPARTVLRFTDYVADLRGAMTTVYRACMDMDSLPDHVPTEHAPRERKHYVVNRTLEQVGIDPSLLAERLRDVRAWCGVSRG